MADRERNSLLTMAPESYGREYLNRQFVGQTTLAPGTSACAVMTAEVGGADPARVAEAIEAVSEFLREATSTAEGQPDNPVIFTGNIGQSIDDDQNDAVTPAPF